MRSGKATATKLMNADADPRCRKNASGDNSGRVPNSLSPTALGFRSQRNQQRDRRTCRAHFCLLSARLGDYTPAHQAMRRQIDISLGRLIAILGNAFRFAQEASGCIRFAPCALILLKTWRNISRLLTYLLQ